MGARMGDLYRELASSSRGRDALLRAVSKGKLSRLLDYLALHPDGWRLVENHAGAVLEALTERVDLQPSSREVCALLGGINPDRLYAKVNEIAERGQLGWALEIVRLILDRHPQSDERWWWLLAQIQAARKDVNLELEALLGVLDHSAEATTRLKAARRLLEIDAWRQGSAVLGELYALPMWRASVIGLLANTLLADGRWMDAKRCSEWDQHWCGILDDSARIALWAKMLQVAGEQVAYDRDALSDGVDAMQACLRSIGGRDLQFDIEQAQLGHELALKLMRFVRSLEPLESKEQPIYMMLLDMLVAWETRWTERGISLEHAMEKDLGSAWVDEQVFAQAVDILWEQFAEQLMPPAKASLRIQRDTDRRAVHVTLEPSDPPACVARKPLAVIDAAFVDRVMKEHGCQWRYDGELGNSLVVSVPTTPPSAWYSAAGEEPGREWFTRWQLHGVEGIASLHQQDGMIREPFRSGVCLAQGLKRSLIADWAEQIRVIVHDLKNLFTFAQQWISQALSDPYSWTMAMERVAEIKERMQETLIEIRELAVLSGPPVYEAVAVVELVRRVISNSRAFLEAHAVTCSIVQKTGRCEIWADHERLTSAITNLLKNGVEAMPDGGQMTITIDQTDGGLVRMIVEDTGIGIEADELPSLFELGRSTKPGGSGVGLAAVARALSGMGAEISVESSLGIGTRFTIVFPQTTIVCAPHSRPLPIPNDRQTRMTQQALRAAAAMYASGDFKMTVHLWCKALIGQIEPPLRRALPPVRARHLLGSVTMSTKRSQQLSQDHRLRLQAILGGSSKQLVKKSDTVIGALIHGDWDRLTHPLHWAILLQILVGKDAYPWPDEDCREMARWLASADQFDELETLDDDRLAGLGTGLCTLLDLALPGHLGA